MSPGDPIAVTLPAELRVPIVEVARQQNRPIDDVVSEVCRRHFLPARDTTLDDEYEKGYQRIPETNELEALVPHLELPEENWE